MIEITQQYIPSLSEDLSIILFDKSSYLLCIDTDQPAKLKINSASKLLLEQIDGKKTIVEITDSFNKQSGTECSTDMIINIFDRQFSGYGILKDDSAQRIQNKDNYLRLRMKLLSQKNVTKLVTSILFLFNKRIFLTVFGGCTLTLTGVYLWKVNLHEIYLQITPALSAWFVLLNVISILFHELGHAGACKYYGAKSGAIGFGFYLFTPVFYADVSDAWRLSRSQRLIVDLAGVYMQLIFCTLFTIYYLASHQVFFLYVSFLITVTLLMNLNPFLRFDGYWALCDAINIPNLMENANRNMKQFSKWMLHKPNQWKGKGIQLFLLLYSVTSFAFIAYFLFIMFVFHRNALIYFWPDLYQFLFDVITGTSHPGFDLVKSAISRFTLPALFYLFVCSMLSKHFLTYLKIKKRTRSALSAQSFLTP